MGQLCLNILFKSNIYESGFVVVKERPIELVDEEIKRKYEILQR